MELCPLTYCSRIASGIVSFVSVFLSVRTGPGLSLLFDRLFDGNQLRSSPDFFSSFPSIVRPAERSEGLPTLSSDSAETVWFFLTGPFCVYYFDGH